MFLLRKNEVVQEEQAMLSLRETGSQGITSFGERILKSKNTNHCHVLAVTGKPVGICS